MNINRSDCYVYVFIDPRDNQVFYVGKGRGSRITDHFSKILRKAHYNSKLSNKVNKIWSLGLDVIKKKIAENLTDTQAFELESKKITEYGIHNLCNILTGTENINDYVNIVNKGKLTNRKGSNNPMFGKYGVVNKKSITYTLKIDNDIIGVTTLREMKKLFKKYNENKPRRDHIKVEYVIKNGVDKGVKLLHKEMLNPQSYINKQKPIISPKRISTKIYKVQTPDGKIIDIQTYASLKSTIAEYNKQFNGYSNRVYVSNLLKNGETKGWKILNRTRAIINNPKTSYSDDV